MPRKPPYSNLLKKFVEVEWADAFSGGPNPWNDITELPPANEELICRTFGMVIAVSFQHLVLAGSINAQGAVGDVNYLPQGMIRQVTPLGHLDGS